MFFDFNGINIYYDKKGSGKQALIFLHGWGQSSECFFEMIKSLSKKYSCFILDFPPFGRSGTPCNFNIYTYESLFKCFIEHISIDSYSIIAHSFGARIAIIHASSYPMGLNKLILIGAAGMKPKRGIGYKIKVLKAKLHLKANPSPDYQKLSDDMKETFKSIVNTHLEKLAKKIKVRTLLLYGENDSATPVYMARRLNRLIKRSELCIVKSCSHFCFLENHRFVGEKIRLFLEEE